MPKAGPRAANAIKRNHLSVGPFSRFVASAIPGICRRFLVTAVAFPHLISIARRQMVWDIFLFFGTEALVHLVSG
jgi:hypothetical protein